MTPLGLTYWVIRGGIRLRIQVDGMSELGRVVGLSLGGVRSLFIWSSCRRATAPQHPEEPVQVAPGLSLCFSAVIQLYCKI